LTAVFTVLTGLVYPLVVTLIAQLAFHAQANGSLIERGGRLTGSALLAQPFQDARYFWPRPSADSYATVPSGASNYGPTSSQLRSNVLNNVQAFRAANGLPNDTPVPGDAVFTSGSGLDPHISPESALMQAPRVAAARDLDPKQVAAWVQTFVEPPQFGFLGEARVNVLRLNLALDEWASKPKVADSPVGQVIVMP